jgi:hypothetical protein
MEQEKKRGRKKKEVVPNLEPVEKKKRGRKKKWETEGNRNVLYDKDQDVVTFNDAHDNDLFSDDRGKKCISFGNLNITVKSASENINIENIKQSIIKKSVINTDKSKCKIILSDSDDDYKVELQTKGIINNSDNKLKTMKIYNDIFSQGLEISCSNYRCMFCHHSFKNKPFFLPYDYNQQLKRYKITGNFCSPNCVKAYALESVTFKNKIHLVAQMYRELFSVHFNIKPSPPINLLKCYGGNLSIEDYRSLFYKNKNYILQNINCKIKSATVSS